MAKPSSSEQRMGDLSFGRFAKTEIFNASLLSTRSFVSFARREESYEAKK